ncbi:MAG: glycosyltransferase family 2 protein [Flavobacterium sp.]
MLASDEKISVIMAAYNCAAHIGQAIQSISDQTHKNFELIIVNDGSTDNTVEVINQFSDARIKLIQQKNKGQCAALNAGYHHSTGRYIKFFDADDVLDKETLEAQIKSLSGKRNCISFINWSRFRNNDIKNTFNDIFREIKTVEVDCTPIEYLTYTGSPAMLQCGLWLIPRELIEKAGLWDERISLINDTEYITRLLLHAERLIYSEKGFLYYRTDQGSGSLSQRRSKKAVHYALISIDLMSKHMLANEKSEKVDKIIAQSYRLLLEDSYPSYKIYTGIIERRLKQYPSDYSAPQPSGRFYNSIVKLFGWKSAVRVKLFYNKILIFFGS